MRATGYLRSSMASKFWRLHGGSFVINSSGKRRRWLTQFRTLLPLLSVLVCGTGGAEEAVQTLDSIRQVAAEYLQAQHQGATTRPTIVVAPLDSRLRLAACAEPLQAFVPPGQRGVGNTSVGIRCLGPTTWTVYVQASVALFESVVVTAHPVARGTVLTADDVELTVKDVAGLTQGYLTDIKEVVGMVAKRTVPAGTALYPGLVKAPIALRRGERVVLLAKTSGVEVRMEGQALTDGAVGDVVRIRNLSSGRVVEGVVVSPGVVEVRL